MTDRANPNPASPSPAPLPISATVICKNEEACIGKCLSSLEGLAEIVVVDSGSRDDTVGIAQRSGARVIEHAWEGYLTQWGGNIDHIYNNGVSSQVTFAFPTATDAGSGPLTASRTACRKVSPFGSVYGHGRASGRT